MIRLEAFALAVLLIAAATLTPGCAPAQAKVQPPVPVEPKILRPGKPQTAHEEKAKDYGPALLPHPTDFILGEEITPPQGCLDLRKRSGNPTAC